jgi:hypothetical protein
MTPPILLGLIRAAANAKARSCGPVRFSLYDRRNRK